MCVVRDISPTTSNNIQWSSLRLHVPGANLGQRATIIATWLSMWCIFFHTNLRKWLRLIKTLNLDTRSDLKQFEIEETLQFKRVNGFICFLLLFSLTWCFSSMQGMTLPPQILCGALSFHTRWSNRHTFCPVALATWQSSKCPKKSKLWGVESLGTFFACIKKSWWVSHEDLYISTKSCPILIGINYTVSRTFSSYYSCGPTFFVFWVNQTKVQHPRPQELLGFGVSCFKTPLGLSRSFLLRYFVAVKHPQIWVPNFVGSKADIHGHPLQKFDLPKDCVSGHLLLHFTWVRSIYGFWSHLFKPMLHLLHQIWLESGI